MSKITQKTIIGIPFYDGESREVLEACLKNLELCVSKLQIDTRVVIGINGPRVSKGLPYQSQGIDLSKFSLDVSLITTPPGIVAAEKHISLQAEKQGYQRIFLTDADISRLPNSLYHMWHQGDKPVVGANYTTYPLEILSRSGIKLSKKEQTLMRIFEADKHPVSRVFTSEHRPAGRIKGSLLLIDPSIVGKMFGSQGITSDSIMNLNIPQDNRQVIPDAAFLHYSRSDITDYFQARLRHFHAAAREKRLSEFTANSIIYDVQTAEKIAQNIRRKFPQSADVAADFLLQCALRHHTATICCDIVNGKKITRRSIKSGRKIKTDTTIDNFASASQKISHLLADVDWDNLTSPVTKGRGVTQADRRVPLDMEPFLKSGDSRKIILDHLGLNPETKV